MYCPGCRDEFRDGFTRCSDCDVDLVAELPASEGDADVVEAPDFATSEEDQETSRPRRWRRVMAAVTLNLCVLPMFCLSLGLILGGTAWGERHPSPAMWAGFAIPVVVATVTCIAWLTRPQLAAWLQVLPLIPMLLSFLAQRMQESAGVRSFERLREHALLIIAAFFAAIGVLAFASAILPRIFSRLARR